MTAATVGPNYFSFTTVNGATAQALTTTAFMRTCTVENQTSQTAYVNVSGGTASSSAGAPNIAIPPSWPPLSVDMGSQLPNANVNSGNTAVQYGSGVSGQNDQSESVAWAVQSAPQAGQISVVLAGNPAANSSVIVTVEA